MDVKGEIYEGLLEKNAQDIKSGAGQYFTPRPLIKAMVDVMRPAPGQTICDPAAGTGGFLLAAHDYLKEHNTLDREQWDHLRHRALHGWEIVDSTARLCVMNLYLHGIGANGEHHRPIRVADSLAADPGDRFDLVLTNPPFGKKCSVTFVNEEGEAKRESQIIVRDDFWTSTSNKQLNFVQHVKTILADPRPGRGGRARQRAVRGRRGRDGPPQAAARVRRAHPAAAADRHLLRPGRQGERALLRPQAGQRKAVDREAVDLRPAHQPRLHPQAEAADPRRPGRVRGLLPPREPARATTPPGQKPIRRAAGGPIRSTS